MILLKTRYSRILLSAMLSMSFLLPGEASASDTDNGSSSHTEIKLTSAERQFVLAEMRGFLESIQQVVKGITNDDMWLVVKGARKSGHTAREGMPASLGSKLPKSFKKLGGDTHRKFDTMALDAEQLGDGEHVLAQLSELLENCVSCHATYRFVVQ